MKVTINDQNETRKDAIVTLTPEEILTEEKTIVKEFMKHAKVRGFRPGKVPESRIRQLYSKDIAAELKQAVQKLAVKELTQRDDLEIVSIVDLVDPGNIDPAQELNIDLTIDVNPEFELPEYTELELEVPSTEVSDSEIDDTIQRILRQRADFKVVERAAEAGDYVKVSYTPSLEGEDLVAQFEEHPNLRSWAAVKESWEEAGTDEAKNYGVPSVIDALVGMAAEETKSVQQTIPEDFLIESLCGKEVEYAITVHEVRERVLPEIDEAFLNSVNAESLEDFKAQILDNLEQQKKDQQHQAKHRAITQKLVEAVDFAIPESTLETERQRAVSNIVGRSLQNGMAENQLEQHKTEIFEHANQSAARDAKLSIILSRIAKKEGIELSNEDLSRAAYSVATQRRQKVDEFVKELQKDSEQMREFQVQVLMAKTAEFIMEKSVTKIVSA